MKKKNLLLFLIGLTLILISIFLMFSNSNKTFDISEAKEKINSIENEINNLEISDKLETTKLYETKISELSLFINELDSSIYEMYKNKEISLYDYIKYKNEIKKYNNQLNEIENLFEKKLTSIK